MRIIDSIVNTKSALRWAASRYKVDDDIAGYTVRGRTYRKDYKKATRHARRTLNMNLRRGLFND